MNVENVACDVPEVEPVVFVYITAPTPEVAEKIANALVSARLAACVNMVAGMTSVYRWNGAIQHDTEVALICKTVSSRTSEIESQVKSLHPYECPCVVTLPVVGGSEGFLNWVNAETRR